MTHTDHTQRIESYINNTLTAAEKHAFEVEMAADPALTHQTQKLHQTLTALHTTAAQHNLRHQLDAIHQTIDVAALRRQLNANDIKRSRILQLWGNAAAAAVAALVVCLSFVAIYHHNTRQTEQYTQLKREVKSISKSQQNLLKAYKTTPNTDPNINNNNENIATFGGTGFPITADGYMITSYHIVADMDSIFAINETENIRLKTEIVATDPTKDLAILRVITQNFVGFGKLPYTISNAKPRLGEYVYTLGYPKTDIVFGEGSISSVSGFEGDTMAYQVSIPVNSGNSGGPLLSQQGRLLGIISGKNTGNQTDGESYAIKAQYLTQMINELQDKNLQKQLYNASKTNIAANRPDQIAKLQKYIYRIEAYQN
jgi:S1-C subfamily serine protease